MRAPMTADNSPLFEYTLMPVHMQSMFSVKELQQWEPDNGSEYGFMKGCTVMKIPARTYAAPEMTARAVANQSTLLYDLGEDAAQLQPLADHSVEAKMIGMLIVRCNAIMRSS